VAYRSSPSAASARLKPAWCKRTGVLILIAFIVGAIIGGATGNSATADAEARATAAESARDGA
jgi:hypothetical protein